MTDRPPIPMFDLPPYRSARRLATWAIGALLVAMSGMLYSCIVYARGVPLAAATFEGDAGAGQAFEQYLDRTASVHVLTMLALALAATLFCMWLFRVSKNVQSTGRPLRISPGWAVASFFIPILSLWRPYVAVSNVWAMSDPDLGPDRPTRGGWLIVVWWIFFLVSGCGTGSVGGFDDVNNAADLSLDQGWVYSSTGLGLVTGALVIAIIHKLTKRQEVFAERYMVPPAKVV